MITNKLYQIVSEHTGDITNGGSFSIKLNPEHEVFKGHFPGYPVLPGVCIIQMIKELTEKIYNKHLQLLYISNNKFLKLINPFELDIVFFELKCEMMDNIQIKVNCSVKSAETDFSKFNGILKIIT